MCRSRGGDRWVVNRVRGLTQVGYFVAVITTVLGLGKFHAKALGNYDLTSARTFPWFLAFAGLMCLTGYVAGIPDRVPTPERALFAGTLSTAASVLGLALAQATAAAALLPRFVVVVAPLFVILFGVVFTALSVWSGRRQQRSTRVVVIAEQEDTARLMADLAGAERLGVSVVATALPADVLGNAKENPLVELIRHHDASLLVLSRAAQDDERVIAQAAQLHSAGVRIRTLSKFYEDNLAKLPLNELERISLMFDISEVHPGFYPRLKRSLDVVVGAVGTFTLVVVAPVVFALNLVGNRGPLLYRQQRVGRRGQVFSIVKFRSMRPDCGPSSWTQEDDDRVTRFGRFLRRSHLDELPQMVNILRGDLSIVGPRPEQPHYVEELSQKLPFYDLRHLVRPGLTGWAQVNYGYGGSEEDAIEKLQYEFFYLRHQSLSLDVIIMIQTLRRILASGNR
jgi:exopolysaccharide biosynthesis polyprenyl glycosylphosphotransferase